MEAAIAVGLGACTFVVHDVGYMLRTPFWLDEAWVALSTRAGLGLVPWLTSSTPLGWTLLLRLVPGGGPQDLRMVPLLFSAAAVVAGYVAGREAVADRRGDPPGSAPAPGSAGRRLVGITGGLLGGAAVLLVPAMLGRDDLKQYTAEAFVGVLLMALVARAESAWSRPRLAWVAAVGAAGLFVANAAAFASVGAMAGLVVAALVRRNRAQILEALTATAAMCTVSGLVYALVSSRNDLPGLVSYWNGYYVPTGRGLSGAVSYLHARMAQLAPATGFGHLSIDAVLALAGCAALVALRRVALAVTVPATGLVLIVASAERKYPFGDQRTSTFLLVMVALLMAVGVAGALRLLLRLGSPALLAGLALSVAGWSYVTYPSVRAHPLPAEDVRSQVAYLDQHRRPGDVVILSYSASWGFAYYERTPAPTYRHITYATTGYLPEYPGIPWLVQMLNRTPADVATALSVARGRLAGSGGGGTIWIVRSHLSAPEAAAWTRDLAGGHVRVLPVGPEPLLAYTP